MRRSFAVAAVACWFALGSASALADFEVDGSGPVRAAFAYNHVGYNYEDLGLAIVREDRLVYHEPVRAEGCEGPPCGPGGYGKRSSLTVADLDGDAEPEVLLELFWAARTAV